MLNHSLTYLVSARGEDYEHISTTLDITENLSASVLVNIINDFVVEEEEEYLFVVLEGHSSQPPSIMIDSTPVKIVIMDDD